MTSLLTWVMVGIVWNKGIFQNYDYLGLSWDYGVNYTNYNRPLWSGIIDFANNITGQAACRVCPESVGPINAEFIFWVFLFVITQWLEAAWFDDFILVIEHPLPRCAETFEAISPRWGFTVALVSNVNAAKMAPACPLSIKSVQSRLVSLLQRC